MTDVCLGTEGTQRVSRYSQAEQPVGIRQPWVKELGMVRKMQADPANQLQSCSWSRWDQGYVAEELGAGGHI